VLPLFIGMLDWVPKNSFLQKKIYLLGDMPNPEPGKFVDILLIKQGHNRKLAISMQN
jgi:hypothetical protein